MRENQGSYKDKNLAFLAEYKKQPGVKELSNGVLYRVLVEGKGDKPKTKNLVSVYYTGKLINGKMFDAQTSGEPLVFKLSQVIVGWKTALREMPVGSRWEVVIPSSVGYGARGAGIIKPHSTLIFDITLLGFE